MTRVLTLEQLRGLRLIAQLLAPTAAITRRDNSVIDVARHMIASQAQQRNSCLAALDLRSGDKSVNAAAAIASGQLVRSWSQRGTHQILATEDVRWVTKLCSPRVLAASSRNDNKLGLDGAATDRARATLLEHSVTPISRKQAYELFAAVDVDPGQGRGQHLLRYFGGEGEIVQGPPTGAMDTFVRLDSLNVKPVNLTGEAALTEITRRYFHSRGVASAKDLQWWTGLTASDIKRGISIVAGNDDIIQFTAPTGEILWAPSWVIDVTEKEIHFSLHQEYELPAFDEYLLSYTDRRHVMDPAHLFSIGPGKNGVFKPFRVSQGEALPK